MFDADGNLIRLHPAATVIEVPLDELRLHYLVMHRKVLPGQCISCQAVDSLVTTLTQYTEEKSNGQETI